MSIVRKYQTTITTVGGAETSSGEATIQFLSPAEILKIFVDFTEEPATTDVTISDPDTGEVVLLKANASTDAVYYPRLLSTKAAEGAAGTLEVPALCERLKVAVAQGNNGKTVAVTVFARI
jgi:hypothetical protein